ncbi:MAG: MBL fold metallo-hydrolase [Candidatus Scalindua sp. AMX11]|nr:MAG: MBL fold metallo-hydrolase [Candidatus Scalindua sp.]NOG86016.1 MBL fold metallo-hydrolase [Planctomycetota bacterium]RZV91355.1 MAG: MBL fold metallo-hydrolase [Candidatus Scalindua sp. SCAELEC01]TDE65912.1 MAG: MBL fold metallo-hydrolase [Candidatus Scalindua sp. AMX11]GJQ60732.1 MAG: MBL fold metallo-hydrolase [Candidatus Scalindua sp.]
MRITFLGTGTSYGVPMIGCECSVCISDNPKNARTRSSILISRREQNILIDAATELRIQCLKNEVKRVDAVLLTHAHADHILGLDDLRHFNIRQKAVIPVYGSQGTVNQIEKMFSYVFEETISNGSKPRFTLKSIDGSFAISNFEIIPIEVMHGLEVVTGYRIGNVAYVTDVSHIPTGSLDKLRGLDLLILDALRIRPHEKHFNIEQALDIVAQLKPKQALFTHIAHEVEYDKINGTLPDGIKLAYDGLTVEV